MIPNLLTIAGFDPSGGAGVAADLKTFAALGCNGMAAVTALTVQNTCGVRAVHVPPARFAAGQVDAIFEDIQVAAVKIGMLAAGAVAKAVAERLAFHKPRFIVLDPVLTATAGDRLSAPGTAQAIAEHLFPLATLITPNLAEAAALAGRALAPEGEDMRSAAKLLRARGAKAVLITGGDLKGETSDDVLFDGVSFRVFSAPRVATRNTHGTGCTLSSAIAAYLAQGRALEEAIEAAKAYVGGALAAAGDLSAGHGRGPLHHFHQVWRS
jgi:hydroxymethylpyrimidine kinase/phosphomethylpyrimidine kinase